MRSFGFLAALMGTAAAAPFMNTESVQSNNVQRSTHKSSKTSSVAANKIKNASDHPLNLQLVNNIGGSSLNCYITGSDSDNRVFFLGADGNLIYPSSGSSIGPSSIDDSIAISMPDKGETLDITVPVSFSSGRIYFSQGDLSFHMVGNTLVQPTVSNANDASHNINWGFVEMSMTPEGEAWANISYVDFVGLVMSMTMESKDNGTQEVVGLASNAVPKICSELEKQGDADGLPWGDLCVKSKSGKPLRVLSPEDSGLGSFDDYFSDYVDRVWSKYKSQTLTIDTQKGDIGKVACRVKGDKLQCEGDNRGYSKPTTADILGCNSGPFTVLGSDNDVHGAIVPRLCAAFNRGTLAVSGGNVQPGPAENKYYTTKPTNHYSRLIHKHEVDGKGYAFPYDDVNPSGSEDAAGLVSGHAKVLTFYAGGKK